MKRPEATTMFGAMVECGVMMPPDSCWSHEMFIDGEPLLHKQPIKVRISGEFNGPMLAISGDTGRFVLTLEDIHNILEFVNEHLTQAHQEVEDAWSADGLYTRQRVEELDSHSLLHAATTQVNDLFAKLIDDINKATGLGPNWQSGDNGQGDVGDREPGDSFEN